jgi:ABC-type lipoprotein export system ATPase subunit
MSAETVIQAEDIVKIYRRGSEEVHAVQHVSVEIKKGEFVSFVGPSGSGKTTLVNLLGCLDNPTSGKITVGGEELFDGEKLPLSESKLTAIRRKYFGYIFQSFYLIPTLTVLENTLLPFTFYKKDSVSDDVMGILRRLGLEHRMDHLPGQLSGGEMQRVAVARALVNKPQILLADEPTGNLDMKRSEEIGNLLKNLNQEDGITIIMVTHNPQLAALADRQVALRDGVLQSQQEVVNH